MKAIFLHILVVFGIGGLFATAPVVSNVSAVQRTDGSKTVDIYYDVYDAENDTVFVSFKISPDEGVSFETDWHYMPTESCVSGDFYQVIPGTNKHIVWNVGNEPVPFDGNQFVIKVIAQDRHFPTPVGNSVLVQGGAFLMGTTLGFLREGPRHQVTVSSFIISRYEVTQAEWLAAMGTNPSSHTGNLSYPVENISWFDAVIYCNQKSTLDILTPCYTIADTIVTCNWAANGYRLPSEAEWEYAARGGNQGLWFVYSGSDNPMEVAFYYGNSNQETKPVGLLMPNELGLYDMSGNVAEWVWNRYEDYTDAPQINPIGPETGSHRVNRGGSARLQRPSSRCTYRYYGSPSLPSAYIGFRPVRNTP